ncbi:phage holin family protein [Demequina activiva]|uniref:Membrane protein n=1 Tax=Demequina activiva TaxID=1582364 RepID=A0A919Q1S6_9MICO|nr:phage holin family protein [Demequina activiva]GIG54044.1 membrane protein [Demequina activiva]
MKFLLNTVAMAVALWIATLLPLDLAVTGGEAEWWQRVLVFLAIGAVIVLLNMIVKPIVSLLALPITILTLGLFALVINWFILWLTAWISEQVDFVNLTVGGFWQTLLAALVISIASAIMGAVLGSRRD